jgi:hypothetical protein
MLMGQGKCLLMHSKKAHERESKGNSEEEPVEE